MRSERAERRLARPQLGTCVSGDLNFFATLCVSANHRESTASIDFGVTNKFQQVGKLENKEFTNNEDWLYIQISCKDEDLEFS